MAFLHLVSLSSDTNNLLVLRPIYPISFMWSTLSHVSNFVSHVIDEEPQHKLQG